MMLWLKFRIIFSFVVAAGDFVIKAFIFCLVCYGIYVVVIWVMRGLAWL